MQGKNHVALALAVPLGAAWALGLNVLPGTAPGWAGLVVGSLLPDVDGGGSIVYLGDWLPKKITPRPVRGLLNGLGKFASDIIRSIFGHRNALHWPAIGVCMFAAGLSLNLDWLMWLGAGYALHIAGDALTKSGVPLFGPLYTGDISFTPMRTGGVVESLFGGCLWLFVGWRLLAGLPVINSAWVNQLLHRFAGWVW